MVDDKMAGKILATEMI